jgi:hypothetical protein
MSRCGSHWPVRTRQLILITLTSVSGPMTSKQSNPNSNYKLQFKSLLSTIGRTLNYDNVFVCEMEGIICSRNSTRFEVTSFQYVSGYVKSCPNVSIPSFLASVVSFSFTGVGCSNSFSFPTSFPYVQYLDLTNSGLGPEFLQSNLQSLFPNLKTLVLNSNDFSSYTSEIQSLPTDLQTLNLDDTGIPLVSFSSGTAQALKYLTVCTYLINVQIKVNFDSLPPSLVSLNVTTRKGVVINENSTVWNLSNLSNLEVLDLYSVSFNQSVQIMFPPSLKLLKFSFCYGAQSFTPSNLNQLTNLETLYVSLAGNRCGGGSWTTTFSSFSGFAAVL